MPSLNLDRAELSSVTPTVIDRRIYELTNSLMTLHVATESQLFYYANDDKVFAVFTLPTRRGCHSTSTDGLPPTSNSNRHLTARHDLSPSCLQSVFRSRCLPSRRTRFRLRRWYWRNRSHEESSAPRWDGLYEPFESR